MALDGCLAHVLSGTALTLIHSIVPGTTDKASSWSVASEPGWERGSADFLWASQGVLEWGKDQQVKDGRNHGSWDPPSVLRNDWKGDKECETL